MKYATLLKAAFLASQCHGDELIEAQFNIRIQDTVIPREMANALVYRTQDIVKYTGELDNRYEQFFIQRNNITEEYVCSIPPKDSSLTEKGEEKGNEPDDRKDRELLAAATMEIHNTFRKKDCVWAYDLRGFYWTYGYCHGDKIIQYHEIAPPQDRPKMHKAGSPNMVYVLGRFSGTSNSDVLFRNQASPQQLEKYFQESERMFRLVEEKMSPFSHQSQKVIMQTITDGSICDMTWQPRSTEVVYRCDASGGKYLRILDVEEIKTCHYRMLIHVPKLCEFPEFVPNKFVQDLVEVSCQRVSDEKGVSVGKFTTFQSLSEDDLLRKDSQFPVRAENRINVAQHEMIALSRGFYLARYTGSYATSSQYFNNRNVILFNGFHLSLVDLNLQVGRTIFDSIGKNFLAPHFNKGDQVMLSWLHSFIMWFEVYNFKGELLGIARLQHDGSTGKKLLGAQIFDPITLLDMDGDELITQLFRRPEYEAPHNMWNFEMFSSSGKSPKVHKKKQNKEKIDEWLVKKTHTVMVYNDGILADGKPNMAVYDENTEEQLNGSYNKDGHYVFELEPNPGQTETFTAPVVPQVDFFGYPVTYYEHKTLHSTDDTDQVTVTVTQTVQTDSATDVKSKPKRQQEIQKSLSDYQHLEDKVAEKLEEDTAAGSVLDTLNSELVERIRQQIHEQLNNDENTEHSEELLPNNHDEL